MKVRRQGGATLGLVAACVLLVIVIGVGFYFLSKIIGGGREVANATDAGALNVARQALKRGTVDLSSITGAMAEFGSLTDPPCDSTAVPPVNTPVTLVTYNRIVAQAMMVCKNADLEGTTQAKTNAQQVASMANQVGAALKTSLSSATGSTLPTDFNNISKYNNSKMWNGSPVTCTGITTGYLKQNGSTNVIWDSTLASTFSGWYPGASNSVTNNNNPGSQDCLGTSIGSNPKYMTGYDDSGHVNSFLGGTVTLTGVPVFPNTKPHLVDLGTFNNDTQTNNATYVTNSNVPNNAFDATAQALEQKSGAMGGSLACAVVGVLNRDFKASLPRGFVRISNGPDAYTGNGNSFGPGTPPISDGTNDIFNNQLYTGPGAAPGASGITQDSSSQVFTTTPGYLTAWSAFNNRTTNGTVSYDNSSTYSVSGPAWVGPSSGTVYYAGSQVPQGDLPTFADPSIQSAASSLGISAPDSISDMAQNPSTYDGTTKAGLRIGATCDQLAALIPDLESIGVASGTFNCNYTMYDDTLTGPCASTTNVNNWQGNYQCTTTLPAGALMGQTNTTQGFTNVEFMKAELLAKIAGRLGGHFCADVSIPTSTNVVNGVGGTSGVKYFPRGIPGTGGSAEAFDPLDAPGSSAVVNFETDASPWQYLSQITTGAPTCASGASTSILEQITARLQQVNSTVTTAQVKTAMQSQILHLKNSQGPSTADNGTLYLYVDPSSHNVAMAASLPSGWTDTTLGNTSSFPDGAAPAVGSGDCNDQYPLNGWVVNTVYTMSGTGKGDAHYHDQPFTLPGNNMNAPAYDVPAGSSVSSADNGGTAPISGQDNAIFKASSGAQNLLGELQFTENTQGTTFCKPN